MGRRQGLTAALAAAVALSLVAPAAAAARPRPARAPAPAGPVERLRRDVAAQLARSGAGVQAAAVALEGLGVVVAVRAGELLPPASTQKLYTAGAALVALGADRRLRTEARVTRDAPAPAGAAPLVPLPLPPPVGAAPAPAPVDRSVVRDLALVAGGDPSLSGERLDGLAAAVAGAGVRRVTGTLWVDDSRHDRARSAEGWKPRFVPEESGPLSALSVDVNGWRRDAAFLSDPATPNGLRFREALGRHGVAVDGPTSLGPLPGGPGEAVAVTESAPVAELARHLLATSDNFQSEVLLKEVGAGAGRGTTAGGVAVVERLQEGMGVPRGRSADGSGLSSLDRQSAAGEVRWLMAVDASAAGAAFAAALPRYCSGAGTLRTRLCGTAAAGRMAAKTGSLPGVVTLAGTGATASGRRVWFAFLLSGVRAAPRARAAVDQAVLALATSGA